MKNVIVVILAVLMSGCASQYKFNEEKQEFKERLTEAQTAISRIQTIGFCGDDPRLKSYTETTNYFSFTCYDGRSFLLRKEQQP